MWLSKEGQTFFEDFYKLHKENFATNLDFDEEYYFNLQHSFIKFIIFKIYEIEKIEKIETKDKKNVLDEVATDLQHLNCSMLILQNYRRSLNKKD